MSIIETHCHLDMLKINDIDTVMKVCREVDVSKIITIATRPSNLDPVYDYTQNYGHVFCSQGIHPHQAIEYDLQTHEKLSQIFQSKKDKVVAVGEIGLDFHYNYSPLKEQLEAFEQQLQIACDFDYPVIIHSRDADEQMITVLKKFTSSLKKKGVIHSFTSGPKLAEFALDNGFHLGFNGIITFKNADNVRDIVKMTPLEQMLIETDSPFLTPIPHRGKENAPFYLPHIIDFLSQLLSKESDIITKQTTQNAMRLFNLPAL